jgi:hypothetical protein
VSRKYLAALIAAAVPLVAVPATADASLTSKYNQAYKKVVKLHGKRAPGRHIKRDGVRTKHGVRPATKHELAQSIRTLRRMIVPANIVRYVKTGPPPVPPSGAQTAYVPGAPPESIAQCESGGNPTTDTGNGFYGKWQFTQGTWEAMGGTGNPAQASEAEQDARAAKLWNGGAGAGNWPVCSRR